MAQNIYDQPAFFEGYSSLPRSVHGLAQLANTRNGRWNIQKNSRSPLRGLPLR